MLALIAGKGALPGYVARAAGSSLVAAPAGVVPEGVSPEFEFRLETIARFLEALRERGVTEVCFAGAVPRPGFDPNAVEPASEPYVARILAALRQGDDGALRTLLAIFEEAGFSIRAAHEIVPDLLPPPGSLTLRAPTRDDDEDAIRAAGVLGALGAADIGQSVCVRRGQVIALEAAFGTDWMLDSLSRRPDGRGGLFYKAPKPGQDRRVDLPAIGPGTVDRAAGAGLDGIVVEAGGVMVLDRKKTVAAANAAGLFLWVRRL